MGNEYSIENIRPDALPNIDYTAPPLNPMPTTGGFVQTVFDRAAVQLENLTPRTIFDEYNPDFNAPGWLVQQGVPKDSPQWNAVINRGMNPESAAEIVAATDASINLTDALSRDSFLFRMATDPAILAEVAFVAAGGLAVSAGKAALFRAIGQQAAARVVPTGLRVGTASLASDLAFQGVSNFGLMLDEIHMGAEAGDAAPTAMLRQLLSSASAFVIGGAIGTGFKAWDNALNNRASIDYITQSAQALLRDYAQYSQPGPAPVRVTGAFDFHDPFGFMDSVMYKFLSTGTKQVLGAKDIPDFPKFLIHAIGNDAGTINKAAAAGVAMPTSIHQRAGAYLADFGEFWSKTTEAWSRVSPSGGTVVAGTNLSDAVQHVRKAIGKTNVTLTNFADEAAILRIRGVAGTAEEEVVKGALDAIFNKMDQQLNHVGLSHFLDDLAVNVSQTSGAIGAKSRLVTSIGARTARKMDRRLVVIQKTLDDLAVTARTRGLTGPQVSYQADLLVTQSQFTSAIDAFRSAPDIEAKIAAISGLDVPPGVAALNVRLSDEIAALKDTLSVLEEAQSLGRLPSQEPYWPRIYNKPYTEAHQDELIEIGVRKAQSNPEFTYYTWDEGNETMVRNNFVGKTEDEIRDYIRGGVRNILDGSLDEVMGGTPSSRFMMRRQMPFDNADIIPFINTNAREVVLTYTQQTGKKIEWARTFGYDVTDPVTLKVKRHIPTIDELKAKADEAMIAHGTSLEHRNMYLKDIDGLYQRVVGRLRDNVDTWDVQVAESLRALTQLTYLGKAGQAATADFSNLLMDHELKNIGRALLSSMDDYTLKMAAKEVNLSGEAWEGATHMMHTKHLETLSSSPMRNGFFDKLNFVYYKANLLEPITLVTKHLDGMVRGHTIIDAATNLTNGTASQWEKVFLARYSITPDLARRISQSPWGKTKAGLIMANTTDWTDELAVESFRAALRNGIANRVIMGTPADKPMMASGKVYIPMNIAGPLGMVEDSAMRGYAKMENALLSLPFTFYSFSMGAMNKITANYAQGTVRNQGLHFAIAMFMGYNIYKLKTKVWQRSEHSLADKLARSLDFSGIAAIHTDMFYRAVGAADGLLDIDVGVRPKFPESPLDVAISPFGAPVEYAAGILQSSQQLLFGDSRAVQAEGVAGLGYSIPLLGNMFTAQYRNNLINALKGWIEDDGE